MHLKAELHQQGRLVGRSGVDGAIQQLRGEPTPAQRRGQVKAKYWRVLSGVQNLLQVHISNQWPQCWACQSMGLTEVTSGLPMTVPVVPNVVGRCELQTQLSP